MSNRDMLCWAQSARPSLQSNVFCGLPRMHIGLILIFQADHGSGYICAPECESRVLCVIIKKYNTRMWTGFVWLSIGTSGGLWWAGQSIFWVAESLPAPEDELYPMHLIRALLIVRESATCLEFIYREFVPVSYRLKFSVCLNILFTFD
jgi:hypothetical protein